MLNSLKKLFCPSIPLPEEISTKDDVISPADAVFSVEEDFDIPSLNSLQRELERAQTDGKAAKLTQQRHGSDWDKLLTLEESRRYVDRWIDDNKLDLSQSSTNLLSENRRDPYSNYAVKNRQLKGNRHIYGKLPYIQSKKNIFKLVLHKWLEEQVKPHAKPLKEVA
jgi:hypothetical protein